MALDPSRVGPKNGLMRRGLAAVLACAAAVAFPAAGASGSASSKPLADRLAKALAVPHVSAAQSAAVALDLSTGAAVFGRNPGLSLVPASNEKLPVTYTALETLGPGYQIATDVLGQGALVGTTWRGLWRRATCTPAGERRASSWTSSVRSPGTPASTPWCS